MIQKRLVLIRHAHRDTENPSLDNGLSEKGHSQVKKMLKFAEIRKLEGATFISSPKKRCIETITPLVKKYDEGTFKIEPKIGEGCSSRDLDEFIDAWKYEGPETLVICSHGDVIPMLVERLTGAMIAIKKCGWVELELVGVECYLTWIVQKYD